MTLVDSALVVISEQDLELGKYRTNKFIVIERICIDIILVIQNHSKNHLQQVPHLNQLITKAVMTHSQDLEFQRVSQLPPRNLVQVRLT